MSPRRRHICSRHARERREASGRRRFRPSTRVLEQCLVAVKQFADNRIETSVEQMLLLRPAAKVDAGSVGFAPRQHFPPPRCGGVRLDTALHRMKATFGRPQRWDRLRYTEDHLRRAHDYQELSWRRRALHRRAGGWAGPTQWFGTPTPPPNKRRHAATDDSRPAHGSITVLPRRSRPTRLDPATSIAPTPVTAQQRIGITMAAARVRRNGGWACTRTCPTCDTGSP